MQLNSYYYSFEKTGVPEVDKFLYAVAKAGRCFHHTSQWQDDVSDLSESYGQRGASCQDWIQNAAGDAARKIESLEKQRAELLEALERITDVARRVDGWASFPSDDIEFAEKAMANAGRDE